MSYCERLWSLGKVENNWKDVLSLCKTQAVTNRPGEIMPMSHENSETTEQLTKAAELSSHAVEKKQILSCVYETPWCENITF